MVVLLEATPLSEVLLVLQIIISPIIMITLLMMMMTRMVMMLYKNLEGWQTISQVGHFMTNH